MQKSLILGSFPTFLRTGYYGRSNGYIYTRVTDSFWWLANSGSAMYGHRLYVSPTNVIPQYNNYRGFGFAVRCVVREGWRRMFSSSLAFGTWVIYPECSLRVAFWIESARMGIKVPKARDELNILTKNYFLFWILLIILLSFFPSFRNIMRFRPDLFVVKNYNRIFIYLRSFIYFLWILL